MSISSTKSLNSIETKMDSKEESFHLLQDEPDCSSQSGEPETKACSGASFYRKQSYRFQVVALASLLVNLLTVVLCLVLATRDSERRHPQLSKSQYGKQGAFTRLKWRLTDVVSSSCSGYAKVLGEVYRILWREPDRSRSFLGIFEG